MSPNTRATRVGLVILTAVTVLAVGIFVIGDRNNLFSRKNLYYVDFNSAGGLKPGSPVELNGVDVGTIKKVDLPENPQKRRIRVWLEVESRYAARVRGPADPSEAIVGQQGSVARIKTLGLLGDKYIEIGSGSPAYPVIPSGGPIPAAQPTNVDALIASGEDVMDNVVQISHSLNAILDRMERGEGILGQLTKDTPESQRLQESLVGTSESLQRIALTIEHGEGPLPLLLNDRALAEQLARSLDRFEGVLAQVQEGPGLLPGLINDPSTRTEFNETLASLHKVASDLEQFTADLETSEALLPKLVKDEEYGREVADQVRQFVRRLNEISSKVSEGEGSAAKLINDPQIYQAVNDVIIGVNESRILRWLIRNRQKKGIEKRYEDTKKAIEAQGGTPEPLDAGPDATTKPTDKPQTAAPPLEETPPPASEPPPPPPAMVQGD
ncbi:MAG TPA: MlaD family protein [Thermoanaerobaculia bacterium]|jgi:phospholipid/cholesterol/gamma-HCH transport system substrate-binding protein|nr:MlaD family protein [Thermoanaerobaculia bacterium]